MRYRALPFAGGLEDPAPGGCFGGGPFFGVFAAEPVPAGGGGLLAEPAAGVGAPPVGACGAAGGVWAAEPEPASAGGGAAEPEPEPAPGSAFGRPKIGMTVGVSDLPTSGTRFDGSLRA